MFNPPDQVHRCVNSDTREIRPLRVELKVEGGEESIEEDLAAMYDFEAKEILYI